MMNKMIADMKKLLIYSAIALTGAVLLASCDKNQPPVFDDANAFVAFSSATYAMDESYEQEDGSFATLGDTLRIPVSLASAKGIEETVKFTLKDSTAKAGVNYKLLTTSGTLSFDAENRTQYIEIQMLYYSEYTGDLKFMVELSKPETVVLGATSSCLVTVGDVDHPLAALLGSYSATSTNGARTNPWIMTLAKDEEDDHMVWIDNIFANPGWAGWDTAFYGNVDDNMTTIVIPVGQNSEYKYNGETPVTLFYLLADDTIYKSGSITVTINKSDDGKVLSLDFGEEKGVYAELIGLGYIGYAYPQIIATKL